MHPIFCTWEISKQSPQIPQQQQQQEEQHVPLPDLSASPQIKMKHKLYLHLAPTYKPPLHYCREAKPPPSQEMPASDKNEKVGAALWLPFSFVLVSFFFLCFFLAKR